MAYIKIDGDLAKKVCEKYYKQHPIGNEVTSKYLDDFQKETNIDYIAMMYYLRYER